ncbi:MAG: tyrosine-type recombinase/integrase, partial [Terriglobia bacterium]
MRHHRASLEEALQARVETLALTLAPRTVPHYRSVVRRFLAYLHRSFPQVRYPSQLRRDPHILGWLRSQMEQKRPLHNQSRIHRLVLLRRLLEDLADQDESVPHGLIRREDFPPQPHYLPRPLSLDDDKRLQEELRRTNDLDCNALLLMRATGLRISECGNLARDCLRQVGPDEWALHVPLGKLHNERLVPVDCDTREIVVRILELRALAPPWKLERTRNFLLPRRNPDGLIARDIILRHNLNAAAVRAGCSTHVQPHQLRHSYATEMLRLGVSFPSLMQLLGHRDPRMTLRYTQVTQQDLQREFHRALQNAAQSYSLPQLPLAPKVTYSAGLAAIREALAATRHLMEMYRRQLADEKTKRKLHRLDRRLLAIASQLDRFGKPEK